VKSIASPLKPRLLVLTLAVATALTACNKEAAGPESAAAPAKAAPAVTLDESKLPPVNRFLASDLDAAKNACVDFNGFVNGK
jgi:putative endopeptidase